MIGARSQDEFVAARRPDWQELDRLLLHEGIRSQEGRRRHLARWPRSTARSAPI